jgi:hypothetical protein
MSANMMAPLQNDGAGSPGRHPGRKRAFADAARAFVNAGDRRIRAS